MKNLLKYFHDLTIHPKNAAELKGLILQLAVQGKLTVNWRLENPDVEPASVLLERITTEKQLLIKRGKIKNDKSFSEISEKDCPFKLPGNWIWTRLKDISSVNGGFAFKSSKYVEKGVRVIRISDFDENGFKDGKIVRYEYSNDLAPYELEVNNIIMAMTGGTVGKNFFIRSLEEQMVVNQRVATIKLIKPVFEAYVNCVIPTKLIQDVIAEAKNSTNDNISMTDIKEFFIPLPPLEEQKAIVSVVEQLFAEVEQLEALTKERIRLKEDFVTSALQQLTKSEKINDQWAFLQHHFATFFTELPNIKKLRESILQLAVQGKLTTHWRSRHPELVSGSHSAEALLERIKTEKAQLVKGGKIKKEKPLPKITADEIPYELPEGWIWCRLGELTELITKGSSPKWQGVQYVAESEGVLFVTSENVGSYKLLWKKKKYVEWKFNEIEPRSILKRNDLLMNIVGGSIGRTAIYDIDDLANINQAVTIIRLIPKISFEYFLHFFNSPTCISYMYDKQVDNARPNLSMGNISKFMIPFPSLPEQKAIVEKVNALMALCDQLEQEIQTSQSTREDWMKSSLREVFS